MACFRKKFSTLCSLNSAPLCIFSTLLHKSEENCFTNIPHPLTKTFCKQPCDWLINRGWGKFSTLWHIQHPTEPAEIQHPLGMLNSAPYRELSKSDLQTLKIWLVHFLGKLEVWKASIKLLTLLQWESMGVYDFSIVKDRRLFGINTNLRIVTNRSPTLYILAHVYMATCVQELNLWQGLSTHNTDNRRTIHNCIGSLAFIQNEPEIFPKAKKMKVN